MQHQCSCATNLYQHVKCDTTVIAKEKLRQTHRYALTHVCCLLEQPSFTKEREHSTGVGTDLSQRFKTCCCHSKWPFSFLLSFSTYDVLRVLLSIKCWFEIHKSLYSVYIHIFHSIELLFQIWGCIILDFKISFF